MLSADDLEKMFATSVAEQGMHAGGDWNISEVTDGVESEDEELGGAEIYQWENRPSAIIGQRLEDCVRALVGTYRGTGKERILRSKLLPNPFQAGAVVEYRTTYGWMEGEVAAIQEGPPIKVDVVLENGIMLPSICVLNIRKRVKTHAEKVGFNTLLTRQVDKLRLSLDTAPAAARSIILSISTEPTKKVRFAPNPPEIIGTLYIDPVPTAPHITERAAVKRPLSSPEQHSSPPKRRKSDP